MKYLILTFLLIPFITLAQDDSAWITQNYTKTEQYITMRDGIKLFTAIYTPKDASEKHPILITRTPYSSGPYGEGKYREYWYNQHRNYFRENYIMVVQDVRGKFMSEGEYMDVRPFIPNKKSGETDESTDTYDTVDWLVKNVEGNNGKVGVFGISYPGFYATQAAVSNHPAVVAVSPQAPVTEWFIGDDFHHNGAFMLIDAYTFYIKNGFGSPRPSPTTSRYNRGFQPWTKDSYNFFLKTGALPNFTKLAGDSMAFWKQMMEHPNYDDFWQKRNARAAMKNIKPAMLIVGGLFDAEDLFGAWNLYKAIEKQSAATINKIVMGPWSHGQWAGNNASALGNVKFGSNTSEWYMKNIELPFFNYHLKGIGDEKAISEATIFFTGINEWKKFDRWPINGVKNQPLYLQQGGRLNWNRSSNANSYTGYVSDPAKPVPYAEGIKEYRTAEYMLDDQRFAANRPDVLVFETDTLTEDVTVAGELMADLRVAISGTDADFVVKLIDVFPDYFRYEDAGEEGYVMNGYQMLVRGEIFRGRYRNSFEKPEPFVQGKITQVKFALPDVAHVFKKGHRIMVQVQSSWFPLADRNPQKFVNIYKATDKDFQKADIKVYHDKVNTSSIILPVVSRPLQ